MELRAHPSSRALGGLSPGDEPPSCVWGWREASPEAKQRWEEDHYMLPPLHYEESNLVEVNENRLRKLFVLGIRKSHVRAAFRRSVAKGEPLRVESWGHAATGRGLHAPTVG